MRADVYLLDENFDLIGLLDNYQSLLWTTRYLDPGEFEIQVTMTTELYKKIRQATYLQTDNSLTTMVLEKNEVNTDAESGDEYTTSGRCLKSILERRIVWNQTTLDGKLEGQLEKLLNANVINPSIEARKIPNFVYRKSTDTSIADLTVSKQLTGDNLLDAITDILKPLGLGFQITLEGKQLVFQLLVGTDRSYEQSERPPVVFSPNFDNLSTSSYSEDDSKYKNVGLVLGEDESEARREYVVGAESASGLKRYELYVDARDIQSEVYDDDGNSSTISDDEYYALLKERGEEKLSETQVTTEINGEAIENSVYQYGVDYFMGDLVQVENEYGISTSSRVTELVYSSSSDGIHQYPTFESTKDEEIT